MKRMLLGLMACCFLIGCTQPKAAARADVPRRTVVLTVSPTEAPQKIPLENALDLLPLP